MLNRDTYASLLCTSLNCTGEFYVMIIGIMQLEPLVLSQRWCQRSFNRGQRCPLGTEPHFVLHIGGLYRMFLKPQQKAVAQTTTAVDPALQPWVEK